MKRAGFTMIELIFVIVILGILAAVAIPKLAATRDDAKLAAELTSVAQAIQNLGAEWTAQGAWTNYSPTVATTTAKCFNIADQNAAADGNVTVDVIGAASADCPATLLTSVTAKAQDNGVINSGATTVKVYQFGGSSVKF